MIDTYFKVLDDGFVALKDYMGKDEDIEQAARVSYGKGTRKINETRGLIRYLMRHRHSTPFEMCELKFHVRVPMDCWRQWIRHRTANVNEYSTRYSEAIDSQQTTDPKEWRLQSTSNKQGSSGFLEEWPDSEIEDQMTPGEFLSGKELAFHQSAANLYNIRLKFGIAREQARKDLPLSTYTEAYWKIDLKNLLHFMSLRCDSHAQLEIRSYANVIAGIVKEIYPLTFEAWYDYAFCAYNWTRLDRQLLFHIESHKLDSAWDRYYTHELKDNKEFIDSIIMPFANQIGMSSREVTEFWSKLFVNEQEFDLDYNNLYETPHERN